MKKTLAACALPAALLLALSAPLSASAHVTASATSTAAGSYTVVTFSVPHGCDGSATTSVAVAVPDGIDSVTPTVRPGWDVSRSLEPIPGASDGSERTAVVTYAAQSALPADLRDAFELSLRLPDGAAGDIVAFDVTQSCEIGETLWTGADAPSIVLTTADADAAAAAEPVVVAPAAGADDVLARVLGGLGLVLGTIGLVIGLSARRKAVR